jgi:peptidoglycan/xylan/chitin deacetylase (PgdA/CDA1 family)
MWSWHQDTRDWSNPGSRKIIDQVLNNAHHGDIVLFHDHGGRRRQTIEALTKLLPELRQRGYEFVTISELLQLRNYKLPPLSQHQ